MNALCPKPYRRGFFVLLSCCLVGLFSACGGQPGLDISQHASVSMSQSATQGASNSQLALQTVPMPATQTSCPATGSARPAVMRPLALGKHQNVVYIYNEIPLNTSIAYGRLKRYDVATGQKTEIVTSGLAIQQAQISADGQWILFISTPDPRGDRQHSGMLQLVRMDGQGLQTLYCFPALTSPPNPGVSAPSVQWSTDEKSVLITTGTNTTSTITLLDLATGKLTTELAITDNEELYHYTVLTWLDNTRAYIVKSGLQGPPPPITLYLLNIKTNRDTNGSDLEQVLTHAIRMSALSMDSSYDGKQLFVAYCLQAAGPFDTTIWKEPASGGSQQTLYHQSPSDCITYMRVISPTTLLMLITTYDQSGQTFGNQVWTMRTDGSDLKTLYTFPQPAAQNETNSLNAYTQFPWSDVSHDGRMYTIQTNNRETGLQTLLFGSLQGGAPTQFASTTRGSVSIVGWTTM